MASEESKDLLGKEMRSAFKRLNDAFIEATALFEEWNRLCAENDGDHIDEAIRKANIQKRTYAWLDRNTDR